MEECGPYSRPPFMFQIYPGLLLTCKISHTYLKKCNCKYVLSYLLLFMKIPIRTNKNSTKFSKTLELEKFFTQVVLKTCYTFALSDGMPLDALTAELKVINKE